MNELRPGAGISADKLNILLEKCSGWVSDGGQH